MDGVSVLRGPSAAGSLHFHFLGVPYALASYPGPEGGGKRSWYLLHAHVPTTPRKPGVPQMTTLFRPPPAPRV